MLVGSSAPAAFREEGWQWVPHHFQHVTAKPGGYVLLCSHVPLQAPLCQAHWLLCAFETPKFPPLCKRISILGLMLIFLSLRIWSSDSSSICFICVVLVGLSFLKKMLLLLFRCSVMSSSLWPHGLWPARLQCSWDFPDKNTGVHCYFLLQGIFLTQESPALVVRFLTTEPLGESMEGARCC